MIVIRKKYIRRKTFLLQLEKLHFSLFKMIDTFPNTSPILKKYFFTNLTGNLIKKSQTQGISKETVVDSVFNFL